MHSEVELSVSLKTDTGKGAARKVRATGKVPGIIYGCETTPTMISCEERELVKALSTSAGRNVFIRFRCDDADVNGTRALIKELQVHPLKRRFVHADFYKLDPNRPIHAAVPVRVEGTSVGVKLGGILQLASRQLEVSCLPDNLPEAIVIDVTELRLGHSIHISDLTPPAGVTFLESPKQAVVAVVSPTDDEGSKSEGSAEG
ncbi:50S ribosomal protein L25 [bacterium]|nr:MAG: 50S ribosomal protein L25 [bacterium]